MLLPPDARRAMRASLAANALAGMASVFKDLDMDQAEEFVAIGVSILQTITRD